MTKRLSFDEANAVAIDFLVRQNMPEDHAGKVADHLIYATLTGHPRARLDRG
ncbi:MULTISPECIES: Ldh family oxidoreductase [unclassified Variovorax]|uniref:Ldh family oxidoreductase n=1 Tax=unclassified Variovorax TaxID=663243 RepID=UPI00076BE5F7|nr:MULTISPECIES: Ldh family oxidoreductase [unclassified Variovorax]KWT64841.1 hypothetical protein APY03_7540 [Variovorax sp. WDL1]PNG46042.1 hypothetical protein CHC06_08020 [Variovorax sp. B2]PNG46301.1 hypothetical protein CHC07_08049 [Variovorax sp. B4]VTV19145.1 Malate/L-lactate dehydrogenases [Variovorax sp. WDL1]